VVRDSLFSAWRRGRAAQNRKKDGREREEEGGRFNQTQKEKIGREEVVVVGGGGRIERGVLRWMMWGLKQSEVLQMALALSLRPLGRPDAALLQ
jgi:hypothetical protein